MKQFRRTAFLSLLIGVLIPACCLFAQEAPETTAHDRNRESEPVEFLMSELIWDAEQQKAFVQIKLKLGDGHITYALKQLSATPPFPTEITFEESEQFEFASEFQPQKTPLRDLKAEKNLDQNWLYHQALVVWKAEITLADKVDLEDVVAIGTIRMLAPTEYS